MDHCDHNMTETKISENGNVLKLEHSKVKFEDLKEEDVKSVD